MPPDHSRAELYLNQGRYSEAADALKLQLADDPEDVEALISLAFCHFQGDTDDLDNVREGIQIVERALALEPEMPRAHAVRALLLGELKKFPAAHHSADEAITLDPDTAFFHGVKAIVFMREQKWALAEEAARRGLALDSEDDQCSAALTHALLMQGKTADHSDAIAYRLERDPDDSYNHFNMGLSSLRKGDHRKAEQHLQEALRLDPGFEPAREALLEAFRARSPVYRAHLWLQFRLVSLPPGARVGVAVGLYILYRIALAGTRESSPTIAKFLILAWVCFALSSFLLRGFGNLIILTDRAARLALNTRDRWEGAIVGGAVATSLIAFAFYGLRQTDARFAIGAACIGLAVPFSVYFQCDRQAGKKLYGTLAAIVTAGSLAMVAEELFFTGNPGAFSFLVTPGILAFIATTWLAAFGVKTD